MVSDLWTSTVLVETAGMFRTGPTKVMNSSQRGQQKPSRGGKVMGPSKVIRNPHHLVKPPPPPQHKKTINQGGLGLPKGGGRDSSVFLWLGCLGLCWWTSGVRQSMVRVSREQTKSSQMAVGQTQWYHFGVPMLEPILAGLGCSLGVRDFDGP